MVWGALILHFTETTVQGAEVKTICIYLKGRLVSTGKTRTYLYSSARPGQSRGWLCTVLSVLVKFPSIGEALKIHWRRVPLHQSTTRLTWSTLPELPMCRSGTSAAPISLMGLHQHQLKIQIPRRLGCTADVCQQIPGPYVQKTHL